jgi:hypothetical protein
MTAQRREQPDPQIERTFAAVRAALPDENAAAFDEQFQAVTHAEVVDLAALDAFLATWHRIAIRIAADPEDWERMHREAAEIEAGTRPLGPTLEEVLARRGISLP